MSHLDTAYKLGSAKAMEQFTSWMDEDSDEKAASAMERLAEKLGGRKQEKATPPKRNKGQFAVRTRAHKGTGFKALKAKLRKKKSMAKKGEAPAWQRLNDQILGKGRGTSAATQPLKQQAPAPSMKAPPAVVAAPAQPQAPTQPTQPAARPTGGSVASSSFRNAIVNKAKAPLPNQPVTPVGGIGGGSRAARQVSQYTNIK